MPEDLQLRGRRPQHSLRHATTQLEGVITRQDDEITRLQKILHNQKRLLLETSITTSTHRDQNKNEPRGGFSTHLGAAPPPDSEQFAVAGRSWSSGQWRGGRPGAHQWPGNQVLDKNFSAEREHGRDHEEEDDTADLERLVASLTAELSKLELRRSSSGEEEDNTTTVGVPSTSLLPTESPAEEVLTPPHPPRPLPEAVLAGSPELLLTGCPLPREARRSSAAHVGAEEQTTSPSRDVLVDVENVSVEQGGAHRGRFSEVRWLEGGHQQGFNDPIDSVELNVDLDEDSSCSAIILLDEPALTVGERTSVPTVPTIIGMLAAAEGAVGADSSHLQRECLAKGTTNIINFCFC